MTRHGCEYCVPKVWDKSMEVIVDSYKEMCLVYSREFSNSMATFYRGWQSVKGYEKVNALYTSLCSAMNGIGIVLEKNYNIMKAGGEGFCREHKQRVNIGNFNRKDYSVSPKSRNDDDEIKVDYATIGSAQTLLSRGIKLYLQAIKSATDQTVSDQKFGYGTSAGENPREAMNRFLNSVESTLEAALNKFNQNLETLLNEDFAASQKQMAASMAENIGDITQYFNGDIK